MARPRDDMMKFGDIEIYTAPRGRGDVRIGLVMCDGRVDYGITLPVKTLHEIMGLLTRAINKSNEV